MPKILNYIKRVFFVLSLFPKNSGTHSFYNLFVTLMGMDVATSGLQKGDSGVQSEPLIFPRIGNFFWSTTGLNYRGSRGSYWSSLTYSKTNSHNLRFDSSLFNPQSGNSKGYGFTVRCFSGTHSFYNLFVTLMGMDNSGSLRDSGVQSEPYLSPRSGYFNWRNSGLDNRGSSGYYWSSHTYSKPNSHFLSFNGSYFYPQSGNYKGGGFAVRWGGELISAKETKRSPNIHSTKRGRCPAYIRCRSCPH